MRVVYDAIATPIEWQADIEVPLIILENNQSFTQIIFDLKRQLEDRSFNVCEFYDENKKVIQAKNIKLLTDLFSLIHNDKIVQKFIEKELTKAIQEEHHSFQKLENYLIKVMSQFHGELLLDIDFELEMTVKKLLKLFKFEPIVDRNTFLENILSYLTIHSKIREENLFVFVNLKSFLTTEDLILLYKECFYRNIHIFLIENKQYPKIKYENVYIIDENLCEIF